MKSRALVLNAMAENLDALKCGGWGVFIAPTTKMVVGRLSVDGRTGLSGGPTRQSSNGRTLTVG